MAAVFLFPSSYTTTLVATGEQPPRRSHRNPLKSTSDRDLQDLAKDAQGQHTPVRCKQATPSKPKPSPIDLAKFSEGFEPELALDYEAPSPNIMEQLLKDVRDEMKKGS